jgi:hypothetical protein
MSPIIIDSGAFSAYTKGFTIKIEDYVEFIEWVQGLYPKVDFEVVNLDVIGDSYASYKNWIRMRELGVEAMPVFHPWYNRAKQGLGDKKFLSRYLKKTDRIAIGGIALMSRVQRDTALHTLWEQYLTDDRGMPKYRVHGMGVASLDVIRMFPWFSVDSTSAIHIGGTGYILTPHFPEWDFSKMFEVYVSTKERDVPSSEKFRYGTLSNSDQAEVRRYVEWCGEQWDGEDGVRESYRARMRVCYKALSLFSTTQKWPRKYEGVAGRVEGVFS